MIRPNPPGPVGGPGSGVLIRPNPPGPRGGPGAGPIIRPNPPGPIGGPGGRPIVIRPNPPGPIGGPGSGPIVIRPPLPPRPPYPPGPRPIPPRRPPIVIASAFVGGLLPPPPIVAAPSVVFSDPIIEQPAPLVPAGNSTAMQIVILHDWPAKDAGLEVNDVILKVDGQRTRTFDELRAALVASSGKSQFVVYSVSSEVVKTVDVNVVNTLIGVSVLEVPVDLDESALSPQQTALEVKSLEDGPAKDAGLAVGDVILGIDNKWVTNEADIRAALAASSGESKFVIFKPGTGKVETVMIAVQDGRIGATVSPVPVDIQK